MKPNKLKAVILDDELNSINALRWELEPFMIDLDIVLATCEQDEAIAYIQTNRADILFLDVDMPNKNGFVVADELSESKIKIIFTTAHDNYAIDAFKINAFDYLLKPINQDDLQKVIDKCKISQQESGLILLLEKLYSNYNENSQSKHIAVPIQEGLEFITIGDIIRCESESNYTKLFIDNEPPILVSKTLKVIENLIDCKSFFRIHNSHLINLKYMKRYNKGKAGSILMKDGSIVPISRNKKGDFLNEI